MAKRDNASYYDDILKSIAKNISYSNMCVLGKKLGYDTIKIKGYVATSRRYQNAEYTSATLEMLRDWHKKRTKEAALKNALMNAGLVHLVPELFPIGCTGKCR